MKKITFILLGIVLFLLALPSVYGQSVPQGMKYQAVARDLAGEVMADQPISIKIALQGNDKSKMVHYIEVHDVTTNQFGLFSLVVGNGAVTQGDFNKIPWSSEDIWMEIGLKNAGESGFATISSSKLLAVPYAFHAGTASKIVDSSFTTDKLTQKSTGVPSQNWSLFGNSKSDPEKDKLGTTDATDFVFITNNEERLRITADGEIKTKGGKFTIGGNLEVQGDSTRINNDLYVGRNVVLNFDDSFDPKGETINYGNFTVQNASATHLTGTLAVDGVTDLNSALNVNNEAATHLTGTLEVGGNTDLKGDLNVDGAFKLNSTLSVKKDVADGGFVATFENSNTGNGDGIKIKLGKAKANNVVPSAMPGLPSSTQVAELKNLVRCGTSADIPATLLKLTVEGASEDLQMMGGLTVGLVNSLMGALNYLLDFPLDLGPFGTLVFPTDISLAALGIPTIDLTDPTFWGIPSLCLSDVGGTPLNNQNEFIRFTDNTNVKVGSIRAVSISDWGNNYLSPTFLFKLRGALTNGVDKKHNRYHFKSEVSSALDDYKTMGVEYSSGNGDYAEWLERSNMDETITAGDIVAVVGGKITKDLTNAEQVMAVSHQPIVLGNVPVESKINFGNNVAFMGQIPVKIMGAVATGDYIVGKGVIKGYGVAIHSEDMTIEDFKYAVGRSWDANSDLGPKLVNTVVGVHNGDFIHILKKMDDKYQQSESRLQTVEAKIDKLSMILTANAQIN
jgi:hypothetical protein